MRVVVALGGNALLQRGEPMTTDVQRQNVRKAAPALALIAADHELVLSHGNGPQVGLLALQAAAYVDAEPSTLDVLGAQTQGMIAYVLEQELRNYFPPTERFATVMTMVEVDKDDAAFANPTKFVGPIYTEGQAQKLAEEKGWPFRKDGESWRRVVPSPMPQHIFELDAIRALLDLDLVVICTGGGGIPTLVTEVDGRPSLSGVEAVIDKDFATELLAREVGADLFVMATDVDAVYAHWGTPDQRKLDKVTPQELRALEFPAGSMGPKVEAAARFVERTGKRAAIGALGEIEQILDGRAGTQVVAA
jgi:carbamate kinase